jgi:hypothetical protein
MNAVLAIIANGGQAAVGINTLAARGLEEQRQNFKELLTESVGLVHFFLTYHVCFGILEPNLSGL